LTNFQALLESAKHRGVKPIFEDFYNMHRAPAKLDVPDFEMWDEFLQYRYDLHFSEIFTEANLTTRGSGTGNVQIPWFDNVAYVDL
jgi:hypothetical protein